ncbi:MAG TPA: family 43 glycosylhydrolase, partial [Bacteroidales bacterium]|nr:family 43 glycosylhydrolase [Bacteroidales bacterium]
AAADPTVVFFKDKYYLFASKSGGYWYSDDLTAWRFIETNEIPTEEWAPTAIAIGDTLFFMSSSQSSSVFYSTHPLTGKWEIARDTMEMALHDPAFFLDDDNRLYLYWGCSNIAPLYGVELDKKDFSVISDIHNVVYSNKETYGWEVRGDYNEKTEEKTYMEGAWVNKYNGKYYMQYSTPGTQFKSYNDGVYVSDNPLGPFIIAEHNPIAYKPEGFACGAGHGSTFKDEFGNYWHFGTVSISQKLDIPVILTPLSGDIDPPNIGLVQRA